MRKIIWGIPAGIVSLLVGYVTVYYLVIPTLVNYPRLASMIQRFQYTDEALWVFIFLSLWLVYWQWVWGRFSKIYLHLFYSVYLFLLFIVLFTKARTYHSFNFDVFRLPLGTNQSNAEFLLNIFYFVPLGFLYSFSMKRWEAWTVSLVTILGIETIQYVFYVGTFDVWDIITNFLGCVIGYEICVKIKPHFQKRTA